MAQIQVLAHRLPEQLGERARQPRPAAIFAGEPCEVRLPAPALGQHTDEVFASLGHGAETLAALREAVLS